MKKEVGLKSFLKVSAFLSEEATFPRHSWAKTKGATKRGTKENAVVISFE